MPFFPSVSGPAVALRKKLYYPIDIVLTHEAVSPNLHVQALQFVGGLGPGFGVCDPDQYGMVMEPNQFTGVAVVDDPSGKRRAMQAISAEFQCASSIGGTINQGSQPFPSDECVDFIAEIGNPLTLPGLDPATVRRPRVRFKFSGGSGARFHGTLYLARQHSGVEV